MFLGLQLGTLCDAGLRDAVALFGSLQRQFPVLTACEVSLEPSLYSAACWPWATEGEALVASIRPSVKVLGVHLPFVDLDLAAPNSRIASASFAVLVESIRFAGRVRADYAALHLRGGSGMGHQLSREGVGARQSPLHSLVEEALQAGLTLCLENADDLRRPADIEMLLTSERELQFCLDVGHLYERIYPASPWLRGLLLLSDRRLPKPFLLSAGLPAMQTEQSWKQWLSRIRDRTGCVHVHNHDGRTAHRPLTKGKIMLGRFKAMAEILGDLPWILEADYRRERHGTVETDLALTAGLGAA